MGRHAQTRTTTLGNTDIDLCSEWLVDVMTTMQIERRNCTRVRLLIEEILLRIRDHFGRDVEVTLIVDRLLGRPYLRLVMEGEPYNPLVETGEELGGWESSLNTAIGLTPQYSYDGVRNLLRLTLPSREMNPVTRIALAIGAALALGFLGMQLMPQEIRQTLTNMLLQPTYDVWVRILNAISGPIIFLTVVTTMLNTRSIDERGGSSMSVIVSYFVRSFAAVIIALIAVIPVFPLDHAPVQLNSALAYNLLNQTLHIVPPNIFGPFVESDTSQLLFLAFTLGCALMTLGSRVDGVKRIVREGNIIGMQIAQWVSRLVPIIAGLFICLELWLNRTEVLLYSWQPLLLALILSVVTLLLLTLMSSHYGRVSPLLLLKKISKPFLIALKTGSLDESFAETQRSCTQLLGIDENYTKIGLPQGLVLYMPISAIGTIAFTLFVARQEDVFGNLIWYLMAIVIAVVVFVATPPVPGANLLAYVVLFQALGISEVALLDAMIFDIIFGIFASAANQAALQLEMVYQAGRLGLLDKEKLRKPC